MILSTFAKNLFGLFFTVPFAAYLVVSGLAFGDLALAAAAVVGTALPHEALHWLAHRALGSDARLLWGRGAFGLPTPAVAATGPQPFWAHRLAVALPGLVLGLTPFAAGAALRVHALVLVGLVGLSMASSDIALLILTLHWPGRARVQDHPSETGVVRLD